VNVQAVRRRFLDYFTEFGHAEVESSSLVPSNDPTLFFVNAGMVQFKDVFTGAEQRDYNRATTVQKCLRVSGKHNDLDNVGRTPRHHTFFEMLGNFSFGDYFKHDAIRHAWTLLTDAEVGYGLDPDKLWITVFEEDEEAAEIWRTMPGVDPARIQRLGAKDNFWSMGDTGPCGPCTEIHYDHGAHLGPAGGPATESDRYVEIWNLVFMQFERFADGRMEPLPRPSVDTGMGLERIVAAANGVYNNYDTDCFGPIIAKAAELAGVSYGASDATDTALRVIADHARATAHLVADGVMPSNEGRGYVLRRIMRRAIRFGVKIDLSEAFLWRVADTVIDHMGEAYPDLERRRSFIAEVVRGEEHRFAATLSKGLSLLEEALAQLDEGAALDGDIAFRLYDTFGFPIDLTEIICGERGYTVDSAGFQAALEAQRERSRQGWQGTDQQTVGQIWRDLSSEHGTTAFLGHTADEAQGRVLAIVVDGESRGELKAGESGLLLADRTPFYGESGGQVGDSGALRTEDARATVTDTTKPVAALIAHHTTVEVGTLSVGDTVNLEVNAGLRDRTRLNHTATHLLHAALRTVLGDHVMQKGSLVGPDRLRFDFSHHKAMGAEELQRVEDLVYGEILRNTQVVAQERTLDEAKAAGAMALFGEKYGKQVRTVDVPGFSLELCGGTHARRTGDIGLFRIQSEGGVAAGVRRLEAQTGPGALAWVRTRDAALKGATGLLRTGADGLVAGVQRLLDDRRRLGSELDALKVELARAQAGDLTDAVREVDGLKVLAAEFSGDPGALRDEADRLRDQIGSGVVVLGSRAKGRVQLVVAVTKDIAGKRVHAGKLIKSVAQLVGGGGGGRPDMAQAGGKNADALPGALEKVYELVAGD